MDAQRRAGARSRDGCRPGGPPAPLRPLLPRRVLARAARAPGSGWRSCARSPSSTAAACTRRTRPAGAPSSLLPEPAAPSAWLRCLRRSTRRQGLPRARLALGAAVDACASIVAGDRRRCRAHPLAVQAAHLLAVLGEPQRLHATIRRVRAAFGQARGLEAVGDPRDVGVVAVQLGRQVARASAARPAASMFSAIACCGCRPNSCATDSILPPLGHEDLEHQSPCLLLGRCDLCHRTNVAEIVKHMDI